VAQAVVLPKERRYCPLSVFSGHLIEEVPQEWGYGPVKKEKRRLRDLDAVMLLRSGSVHGADVIGAYHARRVAPLMARTLLLYEMTPEALLKGTVLARGLFCKCEIKQRIREAMNALSDMFRFLILGHPMMRPDTGFIDLVSLFMIPFLGQSFSIVRF
jgi:hypothetical protein